MNRPLSAGSNSLSFVVVGASGHLACKKILPALFALYSQDLLPEQFNVFGFARTESTDADFRQRVAENLTCRYTPDHACAERMDEFLSRCFYVSGQYDSRDSFLSLYDSMRDREPRPGTDRIFYLAIPPSVFVDVARSIGGAGLVSCGQDLPWSRVVVEKPFGKDRASSDLLVEELANVFTEDQTYRIDHYLGKEVIQNLLVLRFANLVFEPVWNHRFIERVEICWKEDQGVEGRGGYFDEYGIIRDVMQNHLLQILALIAMEPPSHLRSVDIAREKVRVLERIPPLTLDDVTVGQYTGTTRDEARIPGYLEDPTVPDSSKSPTFARAQLSVNTDRWRGVPFIISAGKGLDGRMTEIRIAFREAPGSMFRESGGCPDANELIIRVQPDESINLRVTNKVPGPGMKLEPTDLDLRYKTAFDGIIPDAYENLLLDVVRGEQGLFICRDELAAAWDIFTPVLHDLERKGIEPVPYEFGSTGPA